MYNASCLCGKIKLTINGSITDIIHCHCSRCRKSSGTAYATNGFVLKKHLSFVQGKSDIQSYSAKPGSNAYFCRHCSSSLFSESNSEPLRLRLRLGILDSYITERPASHNFVTSKADWHLFNDKLPHYKAQEPKRSKPPMA